MGPAWMALLLIAGWGYFAYSIRRRWKLMKVGAAENRGGAVGARLGATLRYAIAQLRMRRYPLAGAAHMLIFVGFGVLLLRTLILWGRGFDPSFDFWLFGHDQVLGKVYSLLKDVFAVLVIIGSLVFVYYRVIKRLGRMTLSTEGLIIILIIIVMMMADIFYDGAVIARRHRDQHPGLETMTLAQTGPYERHEKPAGKLTAPPMAGIAEPAAVYRELFTFEVIPAGRKETAYVLEPNSPLAQSEVPGTPIAPWAAPTEMIPVSRTKEARYVGARAGGDGEPPEWTPASERGIPQGPAILAMQDAAREDAPPPRSLEFHLIEPAGSVVAIVVQGLPDGGLVLLEHLGFWTHSFLVLIFLNLLPYSKHFHVITAIPNVYLQSLEPPGRLPPIVDIDGKLEREETLGIKQINQFSWKSILDFYTCTECGRCTDHCPATNTGKKLSPKQFTIDLRDFLYKHERDLVSAAASSGAAGRDSEPDSSGGKPGGEVPEHDEDLVGGVIDPEVIWACTSCRACETECPVFITYVDKIIDMRRYLVQERGEFPKELQQAFRGLESTMNPWSFPAEDRAAWAEGLDVKLMAEHPDVPVLFWVGCMPSFDERAKKVARATAQLMKAAGVDFAILGTEEQCTGDAARRAGNEYLFQMFAKANVEVLNGYGVDKKTIVTICPHCLNTLASEYPDFGGHYKVVHHTVFLSGLIRQGKLKLSKRIDQTVVFHDSCYLGRYNDVYDEPRNALEAIPGLKLVEPAETRDRGMCCGAGGAQMFKEEEPGDTKVSTRRTEQLLATRPDTIASACPFCMRMLTDGLNDAGKENLPQLDIAEILLESVMEENES